ncbi:unnamed protein product [Cylicocyclus nassatus]|uniref:HAT C-terminal dimerisation domain-containing protein n=1 Tax=Cylicocyclus nassatus TaxID=53992 RepID=A0AA36M3G3_CYLNA|nr:unnamed protein product [Cylicocyclus nassatus]
MKEALTLHLASKSHELNHNDLIALDRQIILDVIDFNGDFEGAFAEYVPENVNFLIRGCPNYVDMETNTPEPRLRQRLIFESIDAIQQCCNIRDLKNSMIQFYNTMPASTRKFSKWPSNFREQSDSLHFYRTLLQSSKEMNNPDKVEQAIKCIIVLPGSNADPERSFSAANRLSRDERSEIKTETLDHIMTVQRNGPTVLTVKVQQLASQWMHPAPGDALATLHVRRHMVVHGLNAREDADDIKNLLQEELAKMSIFSVGSPAKPE